MHKGLGTEPGAFGDSVGSIYLLAILSPQPQPWSPPVSLLSIHGIGYGDYALAPLSVDVCNPLLAVHHSPNTNAQLRTWRSNICFYLRAANVRSKGEPYAGFIGS